MDDDTRFGWRVVVLLMAAFVGLFLLAAIGSALLPGYGQNVVDAVR